jgi:hypothetical protein
LRPEQSISRNDSEGVEDTSAEGDEFIDPSVVGDDVRREGNQGTETWRNLQSLNFLATAVPVPETQFLAAKPKLFFLALKTACDQIIMSRNRNPASQLLDAIQGHTNFIGKITAPGDSLENIAMSCLTADQNVKLNDLIYMICTIQLHAGILR